MREIVGPERDALLLQILKRLEDAKPHADAEGWERGWEEALERWRSDPAGAYCEEALVPAFITDQPVRCDGAFWAERSELHYVRDVQAWLADQFGDCSAVYEFGCGTGFNLVALAHLLSVDFCGLDRSRHAVQLVRDAAKKLDLPIDAQCFDMLKPSPLVMLRYAGVFTFGAMEQLGDFRPFIEWLIAKRPARVVHIEPIPELLDRNNLVDWLSLKFHAKRGYTVGLLPYLQAHPKIEVLHFERSHFGSLMLESYARIVWRPR